MDKISVNVVVNGVPIERQIPRDLPLLRFLRDHLKLTGTKEGCGQGHCGTCTVIINGKAVRSCLQKVSGLNGDTIETIEGLSMSENLHPIQEAFLETGAVQCGFCTPGMIMATKVLLEKNRSPSEEAIKKALKNNLCRCTGYVKIIEAVKVASQRIASPQKFKFKTYSPPSDFKFVGASLPDIDGPLKVKGELKFADDLDLQDLGHGKILFSRYPHAEVLSVDISKAEKMKGVRAVITAKDIPGRNRFGILNPDQPVLADGRVRFLGDPVALVIADTREGAEEACEMISVEYQELGGLFSVQDAIKPGAPSLHERGNMVRQIHHVVGDPIEKALASADLVVEGDYTTPFVDHAFLEPEAGVACLSEEGKICVWTCTQMPFELRAQIAVCLGLPEERIRVIATPLGGGLGGKISVTIQVLLALGALQTGRPVKMCLTREESLRFHTKKHASFLHYRTGFAKNGKIVANQAKIVLDAGPYTDVTPIVLDQACIFSCGPYEVPNVSVEGLGVFTNNANGGAMRGFGINQVAFAMEQQLDMAAERLKIDPFELRWINALEVGKSTISGEILRASVPIKETIREAQHALEPLVPLRSEKKIGIGVASGFKNVGAGKGSVDNGGATIQLEMNGQIKVYISSVDMGQGNRTVMAQLCAHELGISQERIDIITGDTDLVLKAVGVVGERATYCSGNAAILGMREFKKVLLGQVAKEFSLSSDDLSFRGGEIVFRNETADRVITLEEIGRRLASKGEQIRVEYQYSAPRTFPISYVGIPESGTVLNRYAPAKTSIDKEVYRNYPAYSYITNVAIVEVDESTGDVAVKKVITAVDVGKAINPQKIEGQIEGSIMMGVGYALSESYELVRGIPRTKTLKACGIPTVDQTPEMITLIVEEEDPGGPYGAKGISEVATVPITPAIINGIYAAVGVRIHDLPATPDKILRGLGLLRPRQPS